MLSGRLYSITPCASRASEEVLSGSHLSLHPDTFAKHGFTFSISTPNMPSRFAIFERELGSAWADALRLGCKGSHLDLPSYTATAMIFYHYWINFGAVSRGAAAIGHAGRCACVRACVRACALARQLAHFLRCFVLCDPAGHATRLYGGARCYLLLYVLCGMQLLWRSFSPSMWR
jgi:hypothetical protein